MGVRGDTCLLRQIRQLNWPLRPLHCECSTVLNGSVQSVDVVEETFSHARGTMDPGLHRLDDVIGDVVLHG